MLKKTLTVTALLTCALLAAGCDKTEKTPPPCSSPDQVKTSKCLKDEEGVQRAAPKAWSFDSEKSK